jgi:mannose/fructose-specific phosphotransferase system component IIA
VEVKIGIQSIPRELILETKASAEEIQRQLSGALSADGSGLLVLSDTHGGTVLVPADKIAYVEFAGSEQRRVGFGS